MLDTGIFDEDRYFDVFVEYAKASAEDICIRIEAVNGGPEAAPVHLIPHLWFRNTWGWTEHRGVPPVLGEGPRKNGSVSVLADDTDADLLKNLPFEYKLGKRYLSAPEGGRLLFTDNESNTERLYGVPSASRYVKDAFHRAIVDGEANAVNPEQTGTKACLQYEYNVPPGGSVVLRLRLSPESTGTPLDDVDEVISNRRAEADQFYAAIQPAKATADEKLVQRQAFAGLLWSKQSYLFGRIVANFAMPESKRMVLVVFGQASDSEVGQEFIRTNHPLQHSS